MGELLMMEIQIEKFVLSAQIIIKLQNVMICKICYSYIPQVGPNTMYHCF